VSHPSGYSEPPTQDDLVEYGCDLGRREMLWLMAVGAACAEVIYCGLDQDDINGARDWYDRERAASNMHDLALEMLR
jgi:hypothetical protein